METWVLGIFDTFSKATGTMTRTKICPSPEKGEDFFKPLEEVF